MMTLMMKEMMTDPNGRRRHVADVIAVHRYFPKKI